MISGIHEGPLLPKLNELQPVLSGEIFSRNVRYTQKHHDEIFPMRNELPKVGLVYKAYRELTNGNLALQLFSLANQQVAPEKFEAVVVVNNTQIAAAAAEIFRNKPELLDKVERIYTLIQKYKKTVQQLDKENLQTLIKPYVDLQYVPEEVEAEFAQYFTNNNISENFSFTTEIYKTSSLSEQISGYKENQATLQILATITQTVNMLGQHRPSEHDPLVARALDNIQAIGLQFVPPHSLQSLLAAAKQAMKKQIRIFGLDMSSMHKAEAQTNLGKVINEGMHIEFSRGATYLSPMDMDEYLGRNGLIEIIQQAESPSPPDVLFRPLEVITPQHPEQLFGGNIWPSLMKYYASSNNAKITERFMQTFRPRQTGKTVSSRKLFSHLDYPEEPLDEDYRYYYKLSDEQHVYYLTDPRSPLLVSYRFRETSFDGGRFTRSNKKETKEALLFHNEQSTSIVRESCLLNKQVEELIENSEFSNAEGKDMSAKLLAEYRLLRKHFFQQQQDERKYTRALFFGKESKSKGIVGKLLDLFQQNPDAEIPQLLHNADITDRQKAFFERNPLLLAGMIEQIKKNKFTTKEEITAFLEKTVPSVFASPKAEEPDYDIDAQPFKQNMADWTQVFKARDMVYRKIMNRLMQGTIVTDKKTAAAFYPGVDNT